MARSITEWPVSSRTATLAATMPNVPVTHAALPSMREHGWGRVRRIGASRKYPGNPNTDLSAVPVPPLLAKR